MSATAFEALRSRLNKVSDLNGAAALMGWDLRTMMPPGGAEVRAERMATIGRLAHETFVDDETGSLLDQVSEYERELPFDSDEAALIRVARRDFEKARKVPSDLQADIIRAATAGYEAWVRARAASDFALLLPALSRHIDLRRQVIAIFREDLPAAGEDYDILLDDYEPGLTAAEVRAVFDQMKQGIIPLVRLVSERADRVDASVLSGEFDLEKQRTLSLKLIRPVGYDDTSWRLDPTQHPFAASMATSDIRLTTRYNDHELGSALFGSLHECGHGLYERGVSPTLERTLLARGASMSWHESQSRLWENLVGRSRAFWTFAHPILVEVFPDQFTGTDAEQLYRAVNKMRPSLIRVEADELTYNLHIILRFELEQALFSGNLDVRDLPDAWNGKMQEYLGIEVPNAAQGVLQDVHWGSGSFGYFPTYALGNVLSAQLWERIKADLVDLDDQIASGDFGPLREWLASRVHVHGRKYLPKELLAKVLGVDAFDPGPLLGYLQRKVDELYGV